jgi:hypothetical protein
MLQRAGFSGVAPEGSSAVDIITVVPAVAALALPMNSDSEMQRFRTKLLPEEEEISQLVKFLRAVFLRHFGCVYGTTVAGVPVTGVASDATAAAAAGFDA